MENAWLYERLFLKLVMVSVQDQKMQRERYNVNQNSFYALPEKGKSNVTSCLRGVWSGL